jgi:hypothetical protein
MTGTDLYGDLSKPARSSPSAGRRGASAGRPGAALDRARRSHRRPEPGGAPPDPRERAPGRGSSSSRSLYRRAPVRRRRSIPGLPSTSACSAT